MEEFAGRCRRLCQKTVRNVEDEATQRIINEEVEDVAAYINGLGGLVGQQVRFRMPHTLEEAVQVAVTVNNAERVRAQDPNRVFSTKRDSSSQGVICYNCGNKGHYAKDCGSPRRDGNPGNNHGADGGRGRPATGQSRNPSNTGNASGKQIRCYLCKKLGHRRDQCPQLMGSNSAPVSPNNHGSAARSPKPTPESQANH